MFVTFEGLDGSGKSTQAERLRAYLERSGREVVATREPGGTPLGEAVRELLLTPGTRIGPWAEATLFAAARAQLVDDVIQPAVARGADVVCDRYVDSSLAYQGIARGLGVDRVLELNFKVTNSLLPDRTYLLLVSPEETLRRRGAGGPDRIEAEDEEFRIRVDRAYRELAERFPRRILALDGAAPPDEVERRILDDLRLAD